jgi:cell division transport system ATP-binding protein
MITFEHVTKRYQSGSTALQDVSFHLDPGEMVFLTGHSGAGKSTLSAIRTSKERYVPHWKKSVCRERKNRGP